MAKIIDDFGYMIKIPEESMEAITLVDNGINPYKNIKNKSLQHKVKTEYKRRLIINIAAAIKKSSKIKKFVLKKIKIKEKSKESKTIKHKIHYKLEKLSIKSLDNLYKQILQHGKTKKFKSPKTKKTQKLRK